MSGTFWLDESTNVRYYERRAFSYGEGEDRVNYTKAGATPSTFASLGFVQVQIQERPDDRFYWVSGPDDTGAYTATPKELEDSTDPDTGEVSPGLKTEWEKKQDTEQFGLLSPSDWMVTRKADTGTDLAPEWQQYRDDVRLTNPLRQDQISQVTTVPELEALVTNPATIPDPEDPDSPPIPNPEPHLIPWPVSPDAQQA